MIARSSPTPSVAIGDVLAGHLAVRAALSQAGKLDLWSDDALHACASVGGGRPVSARVVGDGWWLLGTVSLPLGLRHCERVLVWATTDTGPATFLVDLPDGPRTEHRRSGTVELEIDALVGSERLVIQVLNA